MATLRDGLRSASPPVGLKQAWRTVIQSMRLGSRRGVKPGTLCSQSAVQRALDMPVSPDVDFGAIKTLLAEIKHAGEDESVRLAHAIDDAVMAILPTIRSAPVAVEITGWPATFDATQRAQFLGDIGNLAMMSPQAAALLVRNIDGASIGGARLQVRLDLEPGEILPTVSRVTRERRRPRGAGAWLPHLDEEGRFSLSSQALAERHSGTMSGLRCVVDAFCGCGGDTIAFAQTGLQVIAFELDPQRALLAFANIESMGQDQRVDLRVGDCEADIGRLAAPDVGLFLDPPWGGPQGIQDAATWESLIPNRVRSQAHLFARVTLKAPRSFDVGSLPDWGKPWSVDYVFRETGTAPDRLASLIVVSA